MNLTKKQKILLITIPTILLSLTLIIIFTFTFLQHPGVKSKSKNQILEKFSQIKYIAHRGLFSKDSSKNCCENSIEAFDNAVLNNYAFELDVHLTTDNKLVVIHDNKISLNAINEKNVTDEKDKILINKEIKELSSKEISILVNKYKLYNTTCKVPTLDEVINKYKDIATKDKEIFILIEIKATGYDKQEYINNLSSSVSKLINNNKNKNLNLIIQSFHPGVLKWFKNNDKNTIRGFLSKNFVNNYKENEPKGIAGFFLSNMYTNFMSRPDFIAYEYNFNVKNQAGFNLYKTFYKPYIFAWTIRDKDTLIKAKESKMFDAYIFDSFIPDND